MKKEQDHKSYMLIITVLDICHVQQQQEYMNSMLYPLSSLTNG